MNSSSRLLLLLLLLLLLQFGCHGSSGETTEMLSDGPWFVSEPPAWLEFTNETGAIVSCVASGHPAPTVTWIAASELASSSSSPGLVEMAGLRRIATTSSHNATLIFPPFAATAYRPDVHSVAYRCRASSPAGTILSREMRLRTVLVQSYETQAIAGSSTKGGVAVLRCVVPPAIKNDVQVTAWIQEFTGLAIYPSTQGDGKHHMLPGAGDLYLYGVERSDARVAYRCRTRHRLHGPGSHQQLSSNSASITVTEPLSVAGPTVTTKAAIIQSAVNENVAIPCVVQGYPVPEIRWNRLEIDGQSTPMDESTVSFGVLMLENVQVEDGATYRCTASNSVGQSLPYDVRLDVVEPLRVQLQPDKLVLRVNQGHSTTIQCSFNLGRQQNHYTDNGLSGHSSSVRPLIKWLKDGLAISTSGVNPKYQQSAVLSSTSQEQIWSLRLSNMQRADQGVYQCFVYTDRESAQSSIRLLLGDAAPQMVHTFNEQTLVPGPFVTLRCTAIGNPPPDIVWMLDKQPLQQSAARIAQNQVVSSSGETSGHLNISSAQVEDGGEYTCLARNQAGEVAHSARLNVYGLPFIRTIPKITAVAEADISIKCPVAGYPIMEIIWTKGDDILRTGSKYTVDHQTGILNIQSVSQTGDRGIYTCTVRDRQGHTARRDFTVDVVVAPKMTPFQQMDPNGLKLGERLTLTCSVTKGDLPLSFSWTVDNRPVSSSSSGSSSGPIKIVQIDPYTNLLSVDSLQPGHSGNYSCSVHNVATTAMTRQQQSQSVLIQVPPKMDSLAQPDEQILKQGIRTRLLCGVSQGDKPLEFGWTKDGRPLSLYGGRGNNLADGTHHQVLPLPAVTVREVDADSSVLTFTNLSAIHSGHYQCVARNAAGVARQSAHLSVQVPPFWTVEPRDVSILVGQHFVVHCQADGYPKPNVTWTRMSSGASSQDAAPTPLTNRTAPGFLRVMENGTLVIRSARKSLQGRYTCRAVNRIGQDLTATIIVTVQAGPKFRDSLSRLAVKRDAQASLHCRVEGDSPLHLAWRRSSSSTSLLSSNYRLRIQEKEAPNGMASTLTIPSTQVEDTGIYICIASNSHGQVERDFQLTVLEPPEQPRHLQIQETSSRRVSLSWLPPSSTSSFNPLIAYIVQYRETNQGTWQETDSLSAYSTNYGLEGLQPSTAYQVRVLAETSAGRGPASETVVIATYGEPPGTSPSDLRAVPVSSSSIRLTWSAINRNSWHSSLVGYHLGFRQDNVMSYNFTTVPLMDQQSSEQLELTLSQLRKATKFFIVIRAFNRYGEGPLSLPASAVTLEDVPTASPQSLRCSTSSPQSIEVTWQAPPLSEHNGIVQHYRVHYEPVAPATDDGPQVKTVDGIYVTLTGLLPHSAYRIRVEAATRIGSGPISTAVTCLTDETVPKAPADVKAFSSGPNAVTLCWSSPVQTNGDILHYTLNIKAGGHGTATNSNNIQRHTVAGTQTYYQVESLLATQSSFYEIWLTATNKAGVGEKSKVLRYSPNFKANNVAICSFGRRMVQPWKSSIDLPCRTVGNSAHPNWTFNGKPMAQRWAETGDTNKSNSHLILSDLKKSDQGNYTCWVKSDSISYQLIVIVPPPPPTLHVFQTTAQQIQIQWKLEEDGGSPIRGFLLHWRHADGGDWEERELDRQATSTQLDNLRCGTRYQLYLTCHNAVGTSGPSNSIVARTKGDAPLVPSLASSVLSANSSHITVFLNGWQERGCPVRSFGVDYKMDGETYWTTVSDDVQNLPVIFIEDVQPSTAYQLRVRARTSTGLATAAEYDLVTLDHLGQTPTADRINRAGRQLQPMSGSGTDSGHVILPWWLIGAVSAVGTASLLGLVVACSCLYKTRNESRRLVASALPSESTLADGNNANNTWSHKSHKSGSTAMDRNSSKRSSTYELQSMGTDYSADQHDDIYPYATFELHRDRPRSPMKMLDNPPDFTRLKYGGHHGGASHLKLPIRPPPTWSELSTIEIERHFQGSPTVSDSDLESLPVPDYLDRGHGGRRQDLGSSGFINGFIHQPKDYALKSSLKRFNGAGYSSADAAAPVGESSLQRGTLQKQHQQRPSHPVPKLRLVDQSNLWSGQEQQQSFSESGVLSAASASIVHRPKPSRNVPINGNKQQNCESPLDHSIAV